MDAYKGSPDYVRAGFLADLLGPWCNVEGSELGTHLTALHHAAETSLSIEEHKRAAILLGWIMDDLNNAFQEDWWDQSEDYAEEIKNCQSYYTDTVANWTERAKSFLGEGALAERRELPQSPAFRHGGLGEAGNSSDRSQNGVRLRSRVNF